LPSFEVVCLANSIKHHPCCCIAGLRADGDGWIRPVSDFGEGELRPDQCVLTNATQPEVLDLITIGVTQPNPSNYQPEDWLINQDPWKLISRPCGAEHGPLLAASLYKDELLLGSRSDRVPKATLDQNPATESLALVAPSVIEWHATTSFGKKKTRVRFRLGDLWYDLGLTEPKYTNALRQLPDGAHAAEEIGIPKECSPLLTVSLTPPYKGDCYKVVAAVVVVPTAWGISASN
jgi:hypothetical protein